MWVKLLQKVRHRQEVHSCVRKILNLMFLQHSFWELGFEKRNILNCWKREQFPFGAFLPAVYGFQLSVFWTYQTGACGTKLWNFEEKTIKFKIGLLWISGEPVTYMHWITIFMLYVTQPFRSLEGLYLL